MQVFLEGFFEFLEAASLYYVVQLGRSVLVSIPILLLIMFLRKTLFQKAVFLKSLLWTLLIPVPFIGKLKLFYESKAGVRLFFWWQEFCFKNVWFCCLYLGVAVIFGSLLLAKRRSLCQYVKKLKRRQIEGVSVYISDLEITPFVSGVLRPKIVLPEVVLNHFDEKELKTVVSHEQMHIRQGHLVWYLLWDIVRVLLWMNPFISICTKYFHSDLEDICDKAAIRKADNDFYYYGKVLLKSIRCLKADEKHTLPTVAFVGGSDYENIKRRITRVSEYKPYRKAALWCMVMVTVIGISGFMVSIYQNSYKRCNEMNAVGIYNIEDMEPVVLAYNDELARAITFDEDYLYVNVSVLNQVVSLAEYQNKELGIFFDSYYKIPGIGLGGVLVFVNEADLIGTGCKIPYEKAEDPFWIKLLKWI